VLYPGCYGVKQDN